MPVVFEGSQRVTVTGYTDHLMEPFLSRDGSVLLFNNSNDPSVNTNLHWAVRVNDSVFQYKGEISGVNTASLEGVPTLDQNGILYFVSTREYDQTLASIYQTIFTEGSATQPSQVGGISKNIAGWLNFDVEVSASGENLYFVDGRFDQNGGPYESDIVVARKESKGFVRLSNSPDLLRNINTTDLEYAACISANNLELYFTRVTAPITAASTPQIFGSRRNSANEPFGVASKIQSITGFAEAASISPDGHILYYHKRDEQGKFGLYFTRRVR